MALALRRSPKRDRKIERVEARLNPEQKHRIEYAARLEGTSISDFLVSSADRAAVQAIEQYEFWTLSRKDRDVFVQALLRPPAPSKHMRAAAARYNRRVRAS